MVVLIFEGAQGVGKSSIIAELESKHKLKKLPLPRTTGLSSEEFIRNNIDESTRAMKIIIDAAQNNNLFAVDRFTGSEWAFGHTIERKHDYSWVKFIEDIFAVNRILTVYLSAPWEFMCKNIWQRRGTYTAELYIKYLPNVLFWFEDYLSKTKIPYIRYHVNPSLGIEKNSALVWTQIEEALKKHFTNRKLSSY